MKSVVWQVESVIFYVIFLFHLLGVARIRVLGRSPCTRAASLATEDTDAGNGGCLFGTLPDSKHPVRDEQRRRREQKGLYDYSRCYRDCQRRFVQKRSDLAHAFAVSHHSMQTGFVCLCSRAGHIL